MPCSIPFALQAALQKWTSFHRAGQAQHRLHWLYEQALNWSGLPMTHLRPTVFQQNPLFWAWAAESIEKSGTIRLPFGRGQTSPVAASDVAEVAAPCGWDRPPMAQE
jgi:NAD(P)H dehydrogenase (quinone)